MKLRINFFEKRGQGKERGVSRRTRMEKISLHWQILLGVFFSILLFVFASGYFIFRNIESGGFSFSGAKVEASESKITTALLGKTIEYFEMKRVTFDRVINGRVTIGDPSIW